MNQIKNKPADNDESTAGKFQRAVGTPVYEQPPKVSGEVQSTKLKSMLADLKSKSE